jgi:hypothetical protein
MTLGISIQCNNTECRYARVFYFLITIMLCHCACVSYVTCVMLSAIMLSIIILNVIILNVIMLSVVVQ